MQQQDAPDATHSKPCRTRTGPSLKSTQGCTTPHCPDDEEHTAVSQDALDIAFAVMRGYDLEGEDAVHAIRFYRSALHGFVAQEASGAFGMPESIEQSFALMIRALDVALVAWKRLP